MPDDKIAGIYMGIVYDSLRIMGYKYSDFFIDIKPKCGYSGIIEGPVFTTYGEVVNVSKEEYTRLDNIRLEMYKKEFFSNNPIVFLQANDDVVAHSGDITSLIYQKLGAAGFVTDGNVRDIDIIDKTNFPVFCTGENPIDALDYWAITKYQSKISLQGVEVRPNDYAYASKDGVIIVRQEIFEEFQSISREQVKRETNIRSFIHKQNENFDYMSLVKEFGRW